MNKIAISLLFLGVFGLSGCSQKIEHHTRLDYYTHDALREKAVQLCKGVDNMNNPNFAECNNVMEVNKLKADDVMGCSGSDLGPYVDPKNLLLNTGRKQTRAECLNYFLFFMQQDQAKQDAETK